MALEKFLTGLTSEEDVSRAKYSSYHHNLGLLYEKNLQWERAFLEYRRALQVYPYSVESRKALAALYDKLGYKEKSLEAYSVLADLGLADQKVKDEIETRKRALLDSVSGRWSLPIYPGTKKAYKTSVFYQPEPVNADFPEISSIIADQFFGLMQKYSRLKMNLLKSTYSENDAFVTSRNQGDDYFIIISADPGLRQISIKIKLFSARTGSLLSTFSKYRTGNERIIQALIAASTQTADLLPQRGILSARQFSKGVIDLGSFDVVAKDDVFLIIRAGSLSLKPDKTGFSYAETEILGEFTVTKVEETYSEGTVQKTTFFDQINTGDWVIRKTDKAVTAYSSSEISLPSAFLELR
jgi:tetratricopeptide (TPR) repeat protein